MHLRHVTDDDVYRVYRWKMDPESRRWFASRHTGITIDEHVQWFSEHVTQEHYYVGLQTMLLPSIGAQPEQQHDVPVGAMRVEQDSSGHAWVSIVLAPEHRGHGYGTAMLNLLPNIGASVWARIHTLNIPSVKAFEKADFMNIRREGVWLVYRKDWINGR